MTPFLKYETDILKYKEIVGGSFSSKEQLKKCYAISEEKFSEIEAYILLPETSSKKDFYTKKYQNFEKKELKISGKFNPDLYSESDWQKMGFSDKQAAAIVKYKTLQPCSRRDKAINLVNTDLPLNDAPPTAINLASGDKPPLR